MSSIEDYSGLCGIIPTFADSSRQIRCKFEFGHSGPCSFEKYRSQFYLRAGCYGYDEYWYKKKDEEGLTNGFKQSVLDHSRYDHYTIMLSSNNRIIIR